VGIELRSHFGFRIIFRRLTRLELKIAIITDADGNWSTFYDPKVSRWHDTVSHSAYNLDSPVI